MMSRKNAARLLSLLLVLMIAITPILVSAEETENTMTTEDLLLTEKLEALGVIDVVYDDYDAKVTKRQMAEIIVRFMNLNSEGVAQGKTPFADVSPQDENVDDFVLLYQAGVITGDENYNFHPDRNVTYNEALVFIVNAVGHKLFAVRNGGYPEGYFRTAIQLDLLSGIRVVSGTDAASLRDIYKMLEEALHAGAVVEGRITGGGVDYYVSKTEDFLSKTYHISTHRGMVTGNENTHLESAESTLSDEQIAIGGVVYDTPGYVYGDSLGRSVIYYLRNEKDNTSVAAYVEEDEKKNEVTRIDADDLLPNQTTLTSVYYTDENGKNKHVRFVTNITVIYNGKCYKNFGYLSNVLPTSGYVEALDNTGDGVCEILFVNTYRNIIVAAVDPYAETIKVKGTNEMISLDSRDKNTKVYLHPDNRKLELSKVRVGDVATIMESKGTSKLKTVYIVRNKVSGMITEHANGLGYLINGAYYEKADDYSGPTLSVGMQAAFCLDINGDIVDIDTSYVESDSLIGLMTGIDYEAHTVDDTASVRLYTQNDALETYPVRFPLKIDGIPYEKKDMESAISYLTGGATNADGAYYIRDVYVVQYKLSGGQISSIYTGSRSGSVGQLRKIGEGTSFFVRNGKMLGLEGASPADYASYRPGETLIFACPANGSLDDAKEYGMLDKLISDREYTSSPGLYYQIAIDSYELYDYHNNDAKVAEVILLKGKAPAGAEALTNSSSIGVVTKITGTVAENGATTQKVYTNVSDSAIFDDTFTYKKGTTAVTLSATNRLDSYIKPGDVIRYGTGTDGSIETIEVLTSYDKTNGFVKHFSAGNALGSSNASSNLVSGIVEHNDTVNGVLTFKVAGSATEYMINTEAPRVICYHADREKASEEEISVLAQGDEIVVRVETYYKAAEIIVCR